jgi:hypothetical protein
LNPVTPAAEPTFPLVIVVAPPPLLVTAVAPSSAKLPAVCRMDWANEETGAHSTAANMAKGQVKNRLVFTREAYCGGNPVRYGVKPYQGKRLKN